MIGRAVTRDGSSLPDVVLPPTDDQRTTRGRPSNEQDVDDATTSRETPVRRPGRRSEGGTIGVNAVRVHRQEGSGVKEWTFALVMRRGSSLLRTDILRNLCSGRRPGSPVPNTLESSPHLSFQVSRSVGNDNTPL